jgi:phosphocarrier protein HPr
VIEIDTIISNDLGLHARSAAQIAAVAARASAAIWIAKGDQKANASDIMDILTLECPRGTPVKLIAEEPNDRNVLEAIADLIQNRFRE